MFVDKPPWADVGVMNGVATISKLNGLSLGYVITVLLASGKSLLH